MAGFRFIGFPHEKTSHRRSVKLEADRSARLVSIFLKAGNSEGWWCFFFSNKDDLFERVWLYFCLSCTIFCVFLMVFCFKRLFWPWFVFFLRYWLKNGLPLSRLVWMLFRLLLVLLEMESRNTHTAFQCRGVVCVVLVLFPLHTCRFDNTLLKKSQHFRGYLNCGDVLY